MGTKAGSTAQGSAISFRDSVTEGQLPKPERFQCEMKYRIALSIARFMLSEGLIDENEYCEINTTLRLKFAPIFGGLAT